MKPLMLYYILNKPIAILFVCVIIYTILALYIKGELFKHSVESSMDSIILDVWKPYLLLGEKVNNAIYICPILHTLT